MKFVKGQSGNPGGRPPMLEQIRLLAQSHAPGCIEGLVNISNDTTQPAPARVAAYNSVLDRAIGKPAQKLEGDGDGGGLIVQILKFSSNANDSTSK